MPGATILLIEDDEVLCNILAKNLRERNHQVWIANDAQSALACLRARSFDLILLDINLPDQTGWDVLRIAQREGHLHPEQGKLPVVLMTAVHIGPAKLAEFHPLAQLPKPFPLESILRLAAEAQQKRTRSLASLRGETIRVG